MTCQRRFGSSNRIIVSQNRHAPTTCVLLKQYVQSTLRRRFLTNRRNRIRDESCAMNCECFKCSKYPKRRYCWYSWLGTDTYCSVARITRGILRHTEWVVCRSGRRSWRRPINTLADTWYIKRCMLRIYTVTALITVHPPRIRPPWRRFEYCMDRQRRSVRLS